MNDSVSQTDSSVYDDSPPQRYSTGKFLLGTLVIHLLGILHWTLIGSLGFGCGAGLVFVVTNSTEWIFWGGIASYTFLSIGLVYVPIGSKGAKFLPLIMACFGGAALAVASVNIALPSWSEHGLIIGVGAFILSSATALLKQDFWPVKGGASACWIGLLGGAVFASGWLWAASPLTWAASGALSVSTMIVLSAWSLSDALSEESADIFGANVSASERAAHALRRCWSILQSRAEGWNSFLGGWLAAMWFFWANSHQKPLPLAKPFAVCGLMAFGVYVLFPLQIPDDDRTE